MTPKPDKRKAGALKMALNKDRPVAATTDTSPDTMGITKREHFAAEAMKGAMANGDSPENAARNAVSAADNLLTELAR